MKKDSSRQTRPLQDDLLYGTLSVYETLYFAAMLRLPADMNTAQKVERVDNVINTLGLQKCRCPSLPQLLLITGLGFRAPIRICAFSVTAGQVILQGAKWPASCAIRILAFNCMCLTFQAPYHDCAHKLHDSHFSN